MAEWNPGRRGRAAPRRGGAGLVAAGLALAPSGVLALWYERAEGAAAPPAPSATPPAPAIAAAVAGTLSEVAEAEPPRRENATDTGMSLAPGSGGLILPLPPPPTGSSSGPAPGASPAEPYPLLASTPALAGPAEPDASDRAQPNDAVAATPEEEEGAAEAPAGPAAETLAGPTAPAMLSVAFQPLLKNTAMLGGTAAPLVALDLPLLRLAEVAARPGAVALEGTPGADTLWGGSGADRLSGGGGDDVLFGGGGGDTLLGGAGDDVLLVTGGTASLAGGPGRDLFLIGLPGLLEGGAGRIADFEAGQDALLVAGGPDGFDGYGWLSWGSSSMEILVLRTLFTARSIENRFTVQVAYPPREYWDLSVELPRFRDLWILVSSGTTIIADAYDPATVRFIEAPSAPAEEDLSLPSNSSPATSELDLL